MDAPDPDFVAVVLAGGRGARLGGADKASLDLEGRTLLEHCLDAVTAAQEVVVVGDPPPDGAARPPHVTFTREEPRWGGPAAALLAGLDALSLPSGAAGPSGTVVVLAVDMPRVGAATVLRLCAAGPPAYDGSVLVDTTGRRQLAFALDRAALARVRPAPGAAGGMPLHRLLGDLQLVEVAGTGAESRDVDTWDDLRDLARD